MGNVSGRAILSTKCAEGEKTVSTQVTPVVATRFTHLLLLAYRQRPRDACQRRAHPGLRQRALPHAQHAPARLAQGARHLAVALRVARELRAPPLGAIRRLRRVARAAVPEA